jgi:hypothetical protein
MKLMFSNKRLKLILSGCVVSTILVFLAWPREREPEYNGVSLSAWLNGFEKLNRETPAAKFEDICKSASAVRHIGTNALPFFIRWIQYDEPVWRRSIYGVAWKLPPTLLYSRAGRRLLADSARDRANRAVYGFAFLGTNATPALPELSRLVKKPSKGARQYRAELAIEVIAANIPIPGIDDVRNR